MVLSALVLAADCGGRGVQGVALLIAIAAIVCCVILGELRLVDAVVCVLIRCLWQRRCFVSLLDDASRCAGVRCLSFRFVPVCFSLALVDLSYFQCWSFFNLVRCKWKEK